MRAYERLLKYVSFDTQSDENSTTCPSTDKQRVLADVLAKEMNEIGIQGVKVDENGYVYGYIEATKGMEELPVIGLIAHMDTAPAMSGANIKPHIIENYDGNDIVLNAQKNIVMETEKFPHLLSYIGKTLIVTDGTTLLGADDKAGISEILTAAEELINDKSVSHGKIVIGFTPDEEIGSGADHFDVKGFGADFAYTVDGGALGELEYENFNAAAAVVNVQGANIHPGEAKNKMKSAILMAIEYNSMLPANEIPAHTEGYEGFYHLCEMHGDEETAKAVYIIRDHNMDNFENRKKYMTKVADYLNDKYGEGTFELTLKDSYYNMKKMIEPHMEIIDRAKEAMLKASVTPVVVPIRGGTDGARLSYEGLPCPNLSTGGHNFHGKYEYIPVESIDKMVEIIKNIVSAN